MKTACILNSPNLCSLNNANEPHHPQFSSFDMNEKSVESISPDWTSTKSTRQVYQGRKASQSGEPQICKSYPWFELVLWFKAFLCRQRSTVWSLICAHFSAILNDFLTNLKLRLLHVWITKLFVFGPKVGYHPSTMRVGIVVIASVRRECNLHFNSH